MIDVFSADGPAASFIARLLHRFRWIAYVGLAIILYVAVRLTWEGSTEKHEVVAFRPFLHLGIWGALRPDLAAELWLAETGVGGEMVAARAAAWQEWREIQG